MAHDLGMDVITEGAETESDAVELSQLGCEFAPGLRLRRADERGLGAEIDGRRSAASRSGAQRACENRGETLPRLAKPLRRANLGIGMKFSTDFLDEIRARVPVSQVVGARVKLRKSGREWAGLSPFNAEKTPSFFVNDQKGFYHDFSSGKHGDVFTFLMETEGLGFPEAVEKVAAMAGLPMPARSRESEARDQRRAVLRDALATRRRDLRIDAQRPGRAPRRAAISPIAASIRPPSASSASAIPRPTVSPCARRWRRAASTLAEMIAAGLLAHGEDVAVAYDRFRDRVMFPIHDRGGKLVAFGGRALDPSAKAKYLNSPESELFHKGELLYNHHRARKAAHERGEVIVVEGYVDVIAMTQAGFAHTVAPLGTALTSEQCALLWTMADEPILCFDGDKAGRKAAYRAVDVALPLVGAGQEPAIRHAAGGPGS